jgi:hypothetical protein
VRLVRRFLIVLALFSSQSARADYLAGSFLLDASFGFGTEPHTRQTFECSRLQGSGPQAVEVTAPQCNQVLAFDVTAEALWHGLVGPALGLFVANGVPVSTVPAFGDRISTVLALGVRPLAPLWLTFGDSWATRLAAGLALQAGVSVEHATTATDSATNYGLHAAAWLDVPLVGANTRGGLALRLSARFLWSPEANLQPATQGGGFQVVMPGTAFQFYGGIAYYL